MLGAFRPARMGCESTPFGRPSLPGTIVPSCRRGGQSGPQSSHGRACAPYRPVRARLGVGVSSESFILMLQRCSTIFSSCLDRHHTFLERAWRDSAGFGVERTVPWRVPTHGARVGPLCGVSGAAAARWEGAAGCWEHSAQRAWAVNPRRSGAPACRGQLSPLVDEGDNPGPNRRMVAHVPRIVLYARALGSGCHHRASSCCSKDAQRLSAAACTAITRSWSVPEEFMDALEANKRLSPPMVRAWISCAACPVQLPLGGRVHTPVGSIRVSAHGL